MRRALLYGTSVMLLSSVSFVASVWNRPIWDDEKILGTRLDPTSVSSVFQLWSEPYWSDGPLDTFRPLGLSILYAERRVFGPAVWGVRAVSLLAHGLVGITLLSVLRRIVSDRVAWIATVLFAVHPVHAEAVAMAYGQLELFAALFALLSLREYLRAADSGNALHIGSALVYAFLGMCSKESGLMLPALLIALRGLVLNVTCSWKVRWVTWREAVFLLPAAIYVALREASLGTLFLPADATISYGYTMSLRLKTVIVSLGNALHFAIFPTGQTLYYGHLRDHLIGFPTTEFAWICAGVVLSFLIAAEVGWNRVSLGVAWFLILLFPLLNVIPSGVLFAERSQYLAVAGVSLLVASYADRRSSIPTGPAAILVTLLIIDSNLVVRQWRDNESLWRSTLATYPTSPMAHSGLGFALLERNGREVDAESCFKRALQLNPAVPGGKQGLGIVAMRRGDYRTALAWLEEAQKSDGGAALADVIRECKLRVAHTEGPPRAGSQQQDSK